MNPQIAAALISGGVGAIGIAGTVVTSVVGSKNTRKATEQAIEASAANTRATLAAAREDRLWEKQSALYEETLAAMAYRQSRLTALLRGGNSPWEEASREELEEVIASYGSTEWAARQGRLTAYASDAVRDASGISTQAGGLTRERYRDVRRLLDEQNGRRRRSRPASDHDELGEAVGALNAAFKSAGEADKALIDTIREELRSRPEAAMPPADPPAVRHGFLHRRKAVED